MDRLRGVGDVAVRRRHLRPQCGNHLHGTRNGPGEQQRDGGVNSPITTPAGTTFTMMAGTLAGAATLTTNGTLNWSGGRMTGPGTTTVNGPFNLSGVVEINASRTLNNATTANWTATGGFGVRTGTGS